MMEHVIFRRKPQEPDFPWRPRLQRARDTMSAGAAPERLVARLDDIERALTDAEADDARLAAALAHIDPERANAELKSALREHARRPSPELDARVSALRQRHEAINDLLNQRDRLRRKIDATLLDVEQLAMRAVTLNSAADRGPASAPATVDDNLSRLRDDITALELAHEEINRL